MNINSISSNSTYFDPDSLSLSKTSSASNSKKDDLVSKIDKNGDGSISKEEVQLWADDMKKNAGITVDVEAMFKNFDTDNDGTLTKDQLASALDADRAKQGPPPMGMEGGRPPAPPSSADLASKMDANGDGQVNKSEVQTWADDMKKNAGITVDVDALFAENDSDGDDSMSVDQLAAALEAQRKSMEASQGNAQNSFSYGLSQSKINLFNSEA